MYVCMNDRAPSLSQDLDPALNCALYLDMIILVTHIQPRRLGP